MSKIINLVNNDIFKIKILETINCCDNTIKIINFNKNNGWTGLFTCSTIMITIRI